MEAYQREILTYYLEDPSAFPSPDKAIIIATERQIMRWAQHFRGDGTLADCWIRQFLRYGILANDKARVGIFLLPAGDYFRQPTCDLTGPHTSDERIGYMTVAREEGDLLIFRVLVDATRANLPGNTLSILTMTARLNTLVTNAANSLSPQDRPRRFGHSPRMGAYGTMTLAEIGQPVGRRHDVLAELSMTYCDTIPWYATHPVLRLLAFVSSLVACRPPYDLETSEVIMGILAAGLIKLLPALRKDDVGKVAVPSRRDIPLILHSGVADAEKTTYMHFGDRVPLQTCVVVISLGDHHTVLVVDNREDIALHCDPLGHRPLSNHFVRATEWAAVLLRPDRVRAPQPWALAESELQRDRECGIYAIATSLHFALCPSIGESVRIMERGETLGLRQVVADAHIWAASVIARLERVPVAQEKARFIDELLDDARELLRCM